MEPVDGWRKSSYSGANGGQCIEVATAPGMILVRDSKDTDGPELAFGRETWSAFAAKVKAELDPRATPRAALVASRGVVLFRGVVN